MTSFGRRPHGALGDVVRDFLMRLFGRSPESNETRTEAQPIDLSASVASRVRAAEVRMSATRAVREASARAAERLRAAQE
jgi:hypothetical protein